MFPLPALLSKALIAFTIEFDNEAEYRISDSGAHARFLVSLPMWSNFVRYVTEEGVTVRTLAARAGVTDAALASRLGALRRWGYVRIAPDPADARTRPPARDWIVYPTAACRRASAVWLPLTAAIEKRWEARFGDDTIDRLRAALASIDGVVDDRLPSYLPVVGHAMHAAVVPVERDIPDRELPALLSHVLLAFALEFERESAVSMPIGANALRVLRERGVPIRDLPGLTGASKEAMAVSIGFLARRGLAEVAPGVSKPRMKVARLTALGARAQSAFAAHLAAVEDAWIARFGSEPIGRLRDVLHLLLDRRDHGESTLGLGLRGHPSGWRSRKPYSVRREAMIRDPADVLPQYPLVLHRGGWPDGS